MEALLRTLWFEWPMVHVAVVGVDRSDATIPEALASVRKAVDAGTLSEERAQFLKDRYTALPKLRNNWTQLERRRATKVQKKDGK